MHCHRTNAASCRPTTLLKLIALLSVGLILAYAALPNFRLLLIGIAPLLFSLLCPLMMLFCVGHALRSGRQRQAEPASDSVPGVNPPQQDA